MRISAAAVSLALLACGAESHGRFVGPDQPADPPPAISVDAFGPTSLFGVVSPSQGAGPILTCDATFGFKLKGGPDSTVFVLDSGSYFFTDKKTNQQSGLTRFGQDNLKVWFGTVIVPTGGSISHTTKASTAGPFSVSHYIWFHTNTGQKSSLFYGFDCLTPVG